MSPCSGFSTLTLEVLDRVVKHQRFQGQLQLQALIQIMLEATRFLFSNQIFDLMPSECIPRSIFPGGDTHLHGSAVQIWSPFPQVQPLTVEINTHVTPASVCVSASVSCVRDNIVNVAGSGCQRQQPSMPPEPSGETSNLGFSDLHICKMVVGGRLMKGKDICMKCNNCSGIHPGSNLTPLSNQKSSLPSK